MSDFPCELENSCLPCPAGNPARNVSAEDPDPADFFALGFFGGNPPLNAPPDDYTVPDGFGFCFGATQQAAQDCATHNAQTAVWDPWRTPSGVRMQQYGNEAQSCTVPCSDGELFSYTVPANTFFALSQAEANAIAASYCQTRAQENRICPPLAVTNDATAIGDTTATLNGTVNPNNTDELDVTVAYFEWGTTTAYGNITALEIIGTGTSATAISAALTGLTAGTYHFRVVAVNSLGSALGADKTFSIATSCPDPGFWDLGFGAASSFGIAVSGGKTVNVNTAANLNRFNGATLENTINFYKLASDSGFAGSQSAFVVTVNGAFFAAADVGRVLHWVAANLRYVITGFTSPTQVTVDTSNTIGTNRDSSLSGVTATQTLDVVTASGAFFLVGDVGKNLRWHGTADTYQIIAFLSATQVQVDTSNAEGSQTFSVEQLLDLDVEAYTIGGALTLARINETGDIAASITSGGNNLVRFNTTAPGVPVIVAATGVGRMNAAGHVMGTNGTYYYKNGTSLATGITLAIFNGSGGARDKGRYIAQATDKYIEFQRNALLGQTLRVWDNGVLTNVTPSPLPPLPLFGAAQTIQGRVISPGGSCIVTVIGADSGSNRTFWFITDMSGYSQQLVAALTGVGSIFGVYQINDSKQAAGSVQSAAGSDPVRIEANGTLTSIPLFGTNLAGEGNSINSAGTVVGYQSVGGVNTAFIYKSGVVHNLNDYLPAAFIALGWYLSIADVITDDGFILGRGKLSGVDATFLMCSSEFV